MSLGTVQMREPKTYRENAMKNVKFFKLPWGLYVDVVLDTPTCIGIELTAITPLNSIFKKYGLRLLGVSIAWAAYDWVACE